MVLIRDQDTDLVRINQMIEARDFYHKALITDPEIVAEQMLHQHSPHIDATPMFSTVLYPITIEDAPERSKYSQNKNFWLRVHPSVQSIHL